MIKLKDKRLYADNKLILDGTGYHFVFCRKPVYDYQVIDITGDDNSIPEIGGTLMVFDRKNNPVFQSGAIEKVELLDE